MRVLVISDIHANLAAFEAALADAQGQWEQIWCLGDLIGYGPDPNECVDLLRQHDHLSLSGNHDWAVLGKLEVESFNKDARAAILWTRARLLADNYDFLDALPALQLMPMFTLAHASPRHPVWEYIMDPATAAANFPHFATPYCLVGHTHNPVKFTEMDGEYATPTLPDYSQPFFLDEQRLIINPGSIGQPRDSDPRAAYAFLDTELLTWEYRRVEYDISKTQARMREAGLPQRLVLRLQYGW
jgi:diadenosine tetraphosphatase ApaH/serine/threonine PP2A family protein phosphatase